MRSGRLERWEGGKGLSGRPSGSVYSIANPIPHNMLQVPRPLIVTLSTSQALQLTTETITSIFPKVHSFIHFYTDRQVRNGMAISDGGCGCVLSVENGSTRCLIDIQIHVEKREMKECAIADEAQSNYGRLRGMLSNRQEKCVYSVL
jgi:hypothetical protein